MNKIETVLQHLTREPRIWLITGVAGFIGSNLLQRLLECGQTVVGLDNFSTGHKANLDLVQKSIAIKKWENFSLIEGDIRDVDDCKKACAGVDYVLHQAALGSVPRSINDPVTTNENNISGFLNMLVAARDENVERFVYAASSSTYGDHPGLPKEEDKIGNPLSPYAVTKYVNELYADVFSKTYGFHAIGLRYFNIFGRRQDPNGAYAAVIPKWINSMLSGEEIFINGDGETSRDFCYIENAIQANILAAVSTFDHEKSNVYNISVGDQTSLKELFRIIKSGLEKKYPHLESVKPVFRDFRKGDVKHSLANISRARDNLGYSPTHDVQAGLEEALDWYVSNYEGNGS